MRVKSKPVINYNVELLATTLSQFVIQIFSTISFDNKIIVTNKQLAIWRALIVIISVIVEVVVTSQVGDVSLS